MPSSPLLHWEPAGDARSSADRWLVVLHGIYGAGRNWSTVARRFLEDRPGWAAALVDLRGHGESPTLAPPHTVHAAAEDVRRLVQAEGWHAAALLGHSFGGKVALLAARGGLAGLEQVWLVDSTPAAREPGGSAWEMLGVIRRRPGPFDRRREAVTALREEGLALPVAQWMATNVQQDEDGRYRWRLDPEVMEALLRSFFEEDAWDVVESPPEDLAVHVVKAEGSSVLDEEACGRVEAAGRATGRVHLHRLEGGHWVNVEAPDALLSLLADHL